MTNLCQFCGKQATLVKSHIIPEGLYWGLGGDIVESDITSNGKVYKAQGDKHGSPKVLSRFENKFAKRRPNGFWDRFLCHAHEEQFNEWDTYAIFVLRDMEPQVFPGGWLYERLDYSRLKLFFISLLWRAHATSNNFFEGVHLHEHHAEQLKFLIEKRNPGSAKDFPIMLWRSDEIIAKAIIAPYFEERQGTSFLRLYLPGYMALIKVDHHPLSAPLNAFALSSSGSWVVRRKNYAEEEHRQMLATVRSNMMKSQ
jgi:hypothetical protein